MRAIRVKDYGSLIPKGFESLFGDKGGDDYLGYALADSKAVDLENRTIRFVASDDSVDHHGEIVDAKAFHELRDTFVRNPVLLAAHQHRLSNGHTPRIGSVIEIDTAKNPLVGVARFNDTEAGEDHWRTYKKDGGAFSVGFRVRDIELKEGRTVIVKAELLEISAVPVPANRNALVINHYIASRIATEASRTEDDGKSAEMMAAFEERVAALEKSLDLSTMLDGTKDVGDDDVTEKELCDLVDGAVSHWRE